MAEAEAEAEVLSINGSSIHFALHLHKSSSDRSGGNCNRVAKLPESIAIDFDLINTQCDN